MDLTARIERMRPWIAQGDWAGLERAFRDECRADAADREPLASAVDLAPYTAALRKLISRSATQLGPHVAAVYWEFDVDNDWASAAFLCDRYLPEAAADDDWASDFDPERAVSGPDMPALAALLAPWDGTAADAALNAYLIARTVASFGRAAADWHTGRPLCAGYHDQTVVFRIVPSSSDIPGH